MTLSLPAPAGTCPPSRTRTTSLGWASGTRRRRMRARTCSGTTWRTTTGRGILCRDSSRETGVLSRKGYFSTLTYSFYLQNIDRWAQGHAPLGPVRPPAPGRGGVREPEHGRAGGGRGLDEEEGPGGGPRRGQDEARAAVWWGKLSQLLYNSIQLV